MAIETVKRVWIEKEGVAIEISDYTESPANLQLKPIDKNSEEWFGKFIFVMSPQYAIEIGNALIASGEEKIKK